MKFTKEDTNILITNISDDIIEVEESLQEWEEHPRRLTCLRNAEDTAKEALTKIKTLRKLYDKKVK